MTVPPLTLQSFITGGFRPFLENGQGQPPLVPCHPLATRPPGEQQSAVGNGGHARDGAVVPAYLPPFLDPSLPYLIIPRKAPADTMVINRGEMVQLGNTMGGMLALAGIKDQATVVGISMEIVPEFFPAFWGISFVRAVSVPLNPTLTAEELDFYLRGNAARLVITTPGSPSQPAVVAACEKLGISVWSVSIRSHETLRGSSQAFVTPSYDIIPTRPVAEGRYQLEVTWESGPVKVPAVTPEDACRALSLAPRCQEDDLLCILSTSGTTGLPKRTPIGQRQLLWSLVESVPMYNLSTYDRIVCPVPLFHMFGICTATMPLLTGASLVLLACFEVSSFLGLVREFGITSILAPPAVHRMVLLEAEKNPDQVWPDGQMRFLLTASAPLLRVELHKMHTLLKTGVLSSYGSTEAITVARLWIPRPPSNAELSGGSNESEGKGGRNSEGGGDKNKGDDDGHMFSYEASLVKAGIPLSTIDVALLDDEGRPVRGDRDDPGEICVRSPSTFSGYLGAPEANAECFHTAEVSAATPSPLKQGPRVKTKGSNKAGGGDEGVGEAAYVQPMLFPHQRWYRTGDMGYYDEDGILTVCGRYREFINRGAMKISPLEVENAVKRHPRVKEVAVFGVDDALLTQLVAAALVLHDTPMGSAAQPTHNEMVAFCQTRLAPHKVPSRFYVVSSMPLTSLGKVRRAWLGEQAKADALTPLPWGKQDGEGPRGEVEELVARVWQDQLRGVLKGRRITRGDHLLALGATSLDALAIIGALNKLVAHLASRGATPSGGLPGKAQAVDLAPELMITVPDLLAQKDLADVAALCQEKVSAARGGDVEVGAGGVRGHEGKPVVRANAPAHALGGENDNSSQGSNAAKGKVGANASTREIASNGPVANNSTSAANGSAPATAPGSGSSLPMAPRASAKPVAVASKPTIVSYGQEQMLLFEAMYPGTAAYTAAHVWRSAIGPLDPELLSRSFTWLAERHAVLRTRYVLGSVASGSGNVTQGAASSGSGALTSGAPSAPVLLQRAVPMDEFILPFATVDLSSRVPTFVESEIQRILAEYACHSFDLYGAEALFRAALVQTAASVTAPRSSALVFAIHHSVFDGLSAAVLKRELVQCYRSLARDGRPPALPPLPMQYAEFALWQRRRMEGGGELRRQLDYWRRHLCDAPPLLELPTDRPRPRVQGFSAGTLQFEIEAGTLGGLQALAAESGATVFSALLALWAVALGRCSRQDKVVLGTPWHGRATPEQLSLIGCFINPMPLCVDVPGDASIADVVKGARDALLGGMRHADAPIHKVVGALGLPRDLSYSPIFQVLVMFNEFGGITGANNAANQGANRGTGAAGGMMAADSIFAGGDATFPRVKMDMEVYMDLGGDKDGSTSLQGTLVYSTELFDRTTMEALLQGLGHLARGVASAATSGRAASVRVRDLALAGRVYGVQDREGQGSMGGEGKGSGSGAKDGVRVVSRASIVQGPPLAASQHTLCDLWERQVAARRDAVAICSSSGGSSSVSIMSTAASVTFSQLDRSSRQLARRLVAGGVRPGSRVAIAMGRSAPMVAAMLAVLRAGASYVPLDVGHPPTYQSVVLAAATPAVIITDVASAATVAGWSVPDGVASGGASGVRTLVVGADGELVGDGAGLAAAGAGAGSLSNAGDGDQAEEKDEDITVVSPDFTAICQFTSGSSGTPKGTLLTHRGLATKLEAYWRLYPFAPDDVMLARATVTFIDHALEIYGALLAGAPIVLAGAEEARDPAALALLLASGGVTRAIFVPSLLALGLEEPSFAALLAPGCDGPGLRLCFCDGERLPLALARRFLMLANGTTATTTTTTAAATIAKGTGNTTTTKGQAAAAGAAPSGRAGCKLVNLYGSTEISGDGSSGVITDASVDAGVISVGRPWPGFDACVVDGYGHPVPSGLQGELCMAGPMLTDGYLGMPALTAERFVRLPDVDGCFGAMGKALTAGDGRRWYRMGDRAKLLASGEIVLSGRVDAQVQVHGIRLEPEWVEAVILARVADASACGVVLLGTADALDSGRPTGAPTAHAQTGRLQGLEAGDASLATLPQQLIAVVSPAYVTHEDVVQALTGHVPLYAIPSRTLGVPQLPRLPNGKLDRRRLMRLAEELVLASSAIPLGADDLPGNASGEALQRGQGQESGGSSRLSALEERVAAVWRATLGLPVVSALDNFFAIGGHSLNAVRLRQHMEAADPELAELLSQGAAVAGSGGGQVNNSVFVLPTVRSMAAAAERAAALRSGGGNGVGDAGVHGRNEGAGKGSRELGGESGRSEGAIMASPLSSGNGQQGGRVPSLAYLLHPLLMWLARPVYLWLLGFAQLTFVPAAVVAFLLLPLFVHALLARVFYRR